MMKSIFSSRQKLLSLGIRLFILLSVSEFIESSSSTGREPELIHHHDFETIPVNKINRNINIFILSQTDDNRHDDDIIDNNASISPSTPGFTSTPSLSPSYSESMFPTLNPSINPSSSPSSRPSMMSSSSPSILPSLTPCSSGFDGQFGNTTSPIKLIVNFNYELEGIHNNPDLVIADSEYNLLELISEVELSINRLLLPLIFDNCGDNQQNDDKRKSLRVLNNENQELNSIVGISIRPDDIAKGELCTPRGSKDNICNIIEGKFSIYLSDDQDLLKINEMVINIVKLAMDQDDLDVVHPAFVAVRFIYFDGNFDDNFLSNDDDDDNNVVEIFIARDFTLGIILGISGCLLCTIALTRYKYVHNTEGGFRDYEEELEADLRYLDRKQYDLY